MRMLTKYFSPELNRFFKSRSGATIQSRIAISGFTGRPNIIPS